MVLSSIIAAPNICSTWNICYVFAYKIHQPQSQPSKIWPLCLQSLAESAWMQQLDTGSTARGLAGPANAGKCWEPAHFVVLRLVGTCPIKHTRLLLFPFEVHTSLESPVLYITFPFQLCLCSFAYTYKLSGALFTNPCIQHSDILVLLQSRHKCTVSSSKKLILLHFHKNLLFLLTTGW